jgi:hypothetical protein
VLDAIYGKVNSDQVSAESTYEDKNYTFKVVFKQFWKLSATESLLIVITKAPFGNMHGHSWNLTTLCYLKQKGTTWKKMFSETEEEYLQGSYELKVIGKNKTALIWDWSSTGNHHYERSIGIDLLTPMGAVEIGFVGMAYSDEAFINKEFKADEPCRINNVESTYTFVSTNNEFYDLKIVENVDHYAPGCKSKTTTSKELTYKFDGKRYELQK